MTEPRRAHTSRFTRKGKLLIVLGCILGLSMCSTNLSMATGKFWRDRTPAETASEPLPTTTSAPATTEPTPTPTPSINADKGSALWVAAQLQTWSGPGAIGYTRDKFGQAWKDMDRNGCDNKNDVLRRDMANRHTKPGTNGCVLLEGDLDNDAHNYSDPPQVHFVRGNGLIEIDHVVSLHDAWNAGADTWPQDKREKFANDFQNLEAVASETNQAKGDKTADRWLPVDAVDACLFVSRQVSVKARYGLLLHVREKARMMEVLQAPDCGGGSWPADESGFFAVPAPKPEGESTPTPTPKPEPSTDAPKPEPTTEAPAPQVDPDYGTCAEAKANGAGPYTRGVDPEYEYYRDRDGDGVVCE